MFSSRRRVGPRSRSVCSYVALLAGIGGLAVVASGVPAQAGALSQALSSRGATSATASVTAATTLATQQAAAATAKATTDLATAARSVRSALAAQAIAAAAGTTNSAVSDGLSANGLVVDPRAVAGGYSDSIWANISAPTQTISNGQTTVTLTQTSQRAVATWAQFNVGKNTTVYFNQSAGNSSTGNSWTVLNRIDATGVPSQILGQIKAEGTVLIINPNGIVFGAGSQVNVHTLIAAAMDINGYASGTNYGVFNSTGSYNQITVDGVAQSLNGQVLLAPAGEASANSDFLTSGLYLNNTSVSAGQLLFAAPSASAVGANYGVTVQAGASITAAVSGSDNGGIVALLGPQVTNAGTISAPSGQVILAAGNSLGLSQSTSSATTLSVVTAAQLAYYGTLEWTSSNALGSLGAVATNADGGLLSSERGNVTLFGDTVEQLGDIEVTTSLTRTGTIVLQAIGESTAGSSPASYYGSVVFGPDSVTAILPDENGETIPENSVSSFTAPSITIQNAANVDVQSGALIEAPGASFTINGPYAAPNSSSAAPSGRVLVESGSIIDLAGTNATVSVSDDLYTFKVTANDVADTPEADALIGQTVTIDLRLSGTRSDGETWVGSPLFAATGKSYLGDVAQSIDMLLTKGGSFTVSKGNGLATFTDVIFESGSLVNVSGGTITYTGATVSTTNLRTAQGTIVNIGSADPFVLYTGLPGSITVSHAHWGVSETYSNRLVSATSSYDDPGYIDGSSAGSVSVTAVNPVLEGTIDGNIVIGSRQRALADTTDANSVTTPDAMPSGAALSITLADGNTYPDEVVLADAAPEALPAGFSFLTSPYLNATDAQGHAVAGTLPLDSYGVPIVTYSTAQLSAEDFGSITIKGAALLSMDAGASLTVRSGGSVTLTNVTTIDGTIIAHGGTISLSGFVPTNSTANGNPAATVFPVAYENLVLGPDATLDVSGLWVNDSGQDAQTLQGAAWINGGGVKITTDALSTTSGWTELYDNGTDTGTVEAIATDRTASIVLEAGSVIDLTSGGYVGTTGRLKTASSGLPAGTGGSLSLVTYASSNWISTIIPSADRGQEYDTASNRYAPLSPSAATVVMDGTIIAGGLNKGGTLTLQVPSIVIDGAATSVSSIPSGTAAGTVTLPAAFFLGGFTTYSLTSTYGSITVTPGTTVVVKQQTYQIAADASLPATGAQLHDFASLGTAADGERQAASLSLTELPFSYGTAYIAETTGATISDPSATAGIIVGAGAAIVTDPGASLTLIAGRSLDILGDLIDHGGTLTLAGAQDSWVGSAAVIDVSGVFVPDPLVTAYQTGSELAGGTIAFGLSSTSNSYSGNGAVIIESGAVLDLAGGSATVQEPTARLTGAAVVAHDIWSDGGTLVFYGGSPLYLAGTINAAGGAASAAGGTIELGTVVVSSSLTNGYANERFTEILLSQSGDVSAPFLGAQAPATAAALATLLSQAGSASGTAYVTADTLAHSGFSTVQLDGATIGFSGNVGLTGLKELDLAGSFNLPSTGGATVTLGANYIRLLGYNQITPTLGDGTLTLTASQQIDIEGAVSVSGAANVDLTSGGDIRLIWADDSTLSRPLVSGSTDSTPTFTYTSLNVADNLTLTAREVYVSTGTDGVLLSLGLGSGGTGTITIAANGATPTTPLSAGGSLLVVAPTIVQDGALYAPLGTIQLGVSASEPIDTGVFLAASAPTTSSVILGDGSLTSVSIAGLDVPLSNTINGAWQITSLPAKEIILAGANVATQSGAVLDLSGGGDVYATEFVAGIGGSRNVLTTTSQTVYALVPVSDSTIAPTYPTAGYTPTSWNSGGTDSATAFSVKAGMTVTLSGGNGIAAGTYVLMPAMYATLPGAYRVVVASASTNSAAAVSAVSADGTVYTTGVFGNAVTGERSSATAVLEIQTKAVWSKYSEIDVSSANSAFTSTAATNGTVTPRLPIDAGQLVLAATATLSVDATNLFATATDTLSDGSVLSGRGGLVDITGSDLLVVAADQAAAYAANPAYSGAIVLDADQLSRLGATSLLIGGVRSTTSSGILITPTALDLTVATDAAHPLTAPDLLLVSTASITSTSATTKVTLGSANAGNTQTVTVATGLSGVVAGEAITLYDAGSTLNWISGTVSSYDPATGALTFTETATGSGSSETAISNATVLIATPSLSTGTRVTDGSVIKAVGSVPAGSSQNITIGANPLATGTDPSTNAVTSYTPGISGDGALLRVSNGDVITVTRDFVPGTYSTATLSVAFGPVAASPEGQLSVGAATLSGNAIILDSSGSNALSANATLAAANDTITGQMINFGGTNPSGLTLSPAILAELAGAQSVLLSSYSVFNFYGTEAFGSAAAPIGTLTFDGSGLVGDGGTVSGTAGNVVFENSQASAITSQSGGGGGLNVTANGTVTIGSGSQTWNGFGQVALTAGTEVLFSGSGSVAAGSANIIVTTPAVVADTSASQSLTTSGAISLNPTGGALPTLASTAVGGTLSLKGGSISVANAILAPGGAITLEATSGDVDLNAGAQVLARGSRVVLSGLLDEDVAGGTIKLFSDSGNITIAQGATVDVSAAGNGYAGTLEISATGGTVTLDGTLQGNAAYKDLGGTFILDANYLNGGLPQGASFSGAYSVTLGHGDILVAAGQSIVSGTIVLTANDGSVTVNGTLDAGGPSGGTIEVYGAGFYDGSSVTGGVTIGSTARLYARYQADDAADPAYGNGESTTTQNGGTITLGTSGIGSTTNLDPTSGYEIVLPSLSGWVRVASGAQFDVSGGPGGASISNTGGTVYIRAPIVEALNGTGQNVNVSFNGTLITNADANGNPSGKGLVLQAYATWSTLDQQSDVTKYFDGIIDPAGWYSSSGTLVAGTFTDAGGNLIATWSGSSAPSVSTITTQNAQGSGTQVLIVAAGLDLTVGETIGFDGTSTQATVVSYDRVTGALVVNITSGNIPSWSPVTVLYDSNGLLVVHSSNFYPNMWSRYTDPNGVAYFDLNFPGNLSITAGEAMILKMQGTTFSGTVYDYYYVNSGYYKNGNWYGTGWYLDFYSPSLIAAFNAGDFYNNGANVGTSNYFSFGSNAANAAVSTATTQALAIGTGTKVLTIPAALSYASNETITVTDETTGGSMSGTITSYDATTGALVLDITSDSGAGTVTASGDSWDVAVTLPQSVVNSYLANDYFTPTSTNAAHQTFYGFNPTTGAAGTLMGFVENPFSGNDAAVLANFANASIQIGSTGTPQSLSAAQALHVSPEIDLVNPSTSINSGNISVLTDWNLGAGTAGADGNPVTLYYRYNGWAPTIVLRAVNNVNIDASITDGFFQKQNLVGNTSTSNSYDTAYGDTSTPDTYLYVSQNDSFSNIYWGDITGNTSDVATLSAEQQYLTSDFPNTVGVALAKPAIFTGDTNATVELYYTYYRQYLTEWDNFFNNDLARVNPYFTVSDGGIHLANDPSTGGDLVISTLTAAINAYSTTKLSAYSNYLKLYTSYANDYVNWAFNLPNDPETLPVAPLAPPAIQGAPQPANNVPAPTKTPTDQSPIAGMDLVAEASSSSYKFVAGAAFTSVGGDTVSTVNPDAVISTGSLNATLTGDVTLDGHISYDNTAISSSAYDSNGNLVTYYARVDVPTIVRTGTGSIDLIAAGDIEWLDTLSPAVVYTAGTVAANAADFTQPTLSSSYTSGATNNGLVSTPTWASGGGNLTLSAGLDIIGIETPVDSEMVAAGSGTADAQTLGDNSPSVAQFWSAWYIPLSTTKGAAENSAYINYATFYQGVGALGGGNVTVSAGRNVYDLSVSLPETIQVSGTQTPVAHYYGGGDLTVTIGGNLYSSDFYVGRGTGLIRVAGSVEVDTANPVTGLETGVYGALWGQSNNSGLSSVPSAFTDAADFTALPLLLAEQDSYITVLAGGSISLGGVFEPTRLPSDSYPYYQASLMPSGYGSGFDSYGANSGVTLLAAGGNVTITDAYPASLSWQNTSGGMATGLSPDNLLPPTVEAISVAGDLTIGSAQGNGIDYYLYPSADGNLILAAGQTLTTAYAWNGGSELDFNALIMADGYNTISGDAFTYNPNGTTLSLYNILGTPTPTTQSTSLHANDDTSVLILAGQDIIGDFQLIKPATMEAGRDILDTVFVGQNNTTTQVTSIIAGRDIRSTDVIDGVTYGLIGNTTYSPGIGTNKVRNDRVLGATLLELYGPGDFLVSAGRNLGPFLTDPQYDTGGGIFAVGNGSNMGTNGTVVPYLPTAGASITTLFGVGNGIDYSAAITDYVNPSGSGAAQGIDFLSEIAGYLGLSTADAWTAFQRLSTTQQDLLVDRALLDFLTEVSTDYHGSGPYAGQYARAYDAINTLFPASYGYTNNNTGGSSGASATVKTGDLWMARSRIETQTGGDINILGPGGGITVGANQTDSISPSQEGILTLQGGSINIYADQSVELYQSRIFTEQGGDIDIFSANGDINAGKGEKSKAAYPPLTLVCDTDGYCRVSPAGLVTGGGLGALLTIPGQNPDDSNMTLTAPHGTVDAGAAGIRVAGNLNIVALKVLNAFNINVGGTAVGVPVAATPNLGALTTASDTAGTALAAADAVSRSSRQTGPRQTDLPSIITVEVIGYGGGGGTQTPDDKAKEDEERRRKAREQRSQNPSSAVQVVGAGGLTDQEKRMLTEEEKQNLVQ